MRMTCPQLGSDKMCTLRYFRNALILVSLFMILSIFYYWEEEGFFFFFNPRNILSGPQASRPSPVNHSIPRYETVFNEDDFIPSHKHISKERKKRQHDRKQLVHDMCSTNSTLDFPGKSRTFGDIPSEELHHLIVDDHHKIIYCYVPKVSCTHWKRIMIVLSETLLVHGVPYRDPMDVPKKFVHDPEVHLTLNKVPQNLRNAKLKNYTKFLFVRDPFVRLISAFRNKFQKTNQYFYQEYSTILLKKYGKYSNPPASVIDAFRSGIQPSFPNFIQYLLDPMTEKERSFNDHWKQVYRLCHPCQINYDFIGKLETVDEDVGHLLQTLQVDNINFPSSHGIKTTRSWLQEWFSNIPCETTSKLYKLYEPDFKLFGYPKPGKIVK